MKISIIILVYNHEKYIEDCLKSVINQTFFEKCDVFIYNDCSTDESEKKILPIIKGHKNIHYTRRKINLGAINNYIDAFTNVNTDYIAYLEGDDFWNDSLKIEKQFNILENNLDCSFVSTSANIINPNNEIIRKIHVDEIFTLDNFIDSGINKIFTTSMFMRNFEELSDINKYGSEIVADIALKIMLLARGNGVVLPEYSLMYRSAQDENSSFSSKSIEYRYREVNKALLTISNYYKVNGIEKLMMSNGKIILIIGLMDNGKYYKATTQILKSDFATKKVFLVIAKDNLRSFFK